MLFLVFERNSEVPWFESKCDIGNNSDQKFREGESSLAEMAFGF